MIYRRELIDPGKDKEEFELLCDILEAAYNPGTCEKLFKAETAEEKTEQQELEI